MLAFLSIFAIKGFFSDRLTEYIFNIIEGSLDIDMNYNLSQIKYIFGMIWWEGRQ